MASSISMIEYLSEQINSVGIVTNKKMFGEYIIYCNSKPIFLVCNDTLYIKQIQQVQTLLAGLETGEPYGGAKPHFIVEDIDNRELLIDLARILEKFTPLPKPKKKKIKDNG